MAVDNKAKYISVAVTTEGEISRTIPGSPPEPAPSGVVWAVTTSCKFLPFTLTQTGDTAPLLPQTADDPVAPPYPFTKTLFDIDVDSTGNQYMFRLARNADNSTFYSIDVYAPGTRGWNPAPTKKQSIFGASTLMDFLFGNSAYGGICLSPDGAHIYVANEQSIIRFNATDDGDATGTLIVTHAGGVIFTRVYYDVTRDWLWVSLGAGDGPGILAYDLNGMLQRTISCSLYWNPFTDSVDSLAIDKDGNIYGIVPNQHDDNGDFANIIYVFASSANGDSVPIRRMQLELSDGSPAGIDVSKDATVVYACYQAGGANSSHILSVPNVNGIYPVNQLSTDINGVATLLDFDFGVPAVIDAVQSIRIINHYP